MNRNRRNFLKVAGLAAIGAMLPTTAAPIGDDAANKPLSEREQDLFQAMLDVADLYRRSPAETRKDILADYYRTIERFEDKTGIELFYQFGRSLEKRWGGAA